MLTMTSNAAAVLDEIRQQQQVPEEYGLRVYPTESPQGVQVQLGFSPEPTTGDEVSESEGKKLFVAPELAEPLSESVIDAEKTPEGTRLVLRSSD